MNNYVRSIQTLFAYNAALRPNEHNSTDDSGIWRHPPLHPAAISFITSSDGTRGIRLEIRDSKAHRRSADPIERSTPHFIYFPQRADALDVVGPVQQLMTVTDRDPKSWSQPLFPRIEKGAVVEEHMRVDDYNTWLRSSLAQHKLPVTTAQGLRSGRRSDLTDEGVREEIILQLGRWKSAGASRRYYQTSAECMGSLQPKHNAVISTALPPITPTTSEEDSDYSSSEDEEDLFANIITSVAAGKGPTECTGAYILC